MKKITFYAKNQLIDPESKERTTVQLRSYDKKGKYNRYEGNATIRFVGISVEEAFELVRKCLLNSQLLSDYFEIDEGEKGE